LIHIKGWRFDIIPHGISSAMREQERAASSVRPGDGAVTSKGPFRACLEWSQIPENKLVPTA